MKNLYEKVYREFGFNELNEWGLYMDRTKGKLIPNSSTKPVQSILKHGQMIYLLKNRHDEAQSLANVDQISQAYVEEDEIDKYLSKLDGKIERKRDAQLCHHGAQGRCINCTPIEPFDQEYLANHDPPIKYMSFHAYIRKLQSGVDK